jgi:hypothetical protein
MLFPSPRSGNDASGTPSGLVLSQLQLRYTGTGRLLAPLRAAPRDDVNYLDQRVQFVLFLRHLARSAAVWVRAMAIGRHSAPAQKDGDQTMQVGSIEDDSQQQSATAAALQVPAYVQSPLICHQPSEGQSLAEEALHCTLRSTAARSS